VVGVIGVLAPIAIPNFLKARAASQTNSCINALRQIDYAKQMWATETLQGPAAVAIPDDLLPYLGRGDGNIDNMFCPLDPGRSFDTSYSIGNVLTAPVCNIDGADHALL
jgi:type II secretory pathway pseudopilin PulG